MDIALLLFGWLWALAAGRAAPSAPTQTPVKPGPPAPWPQVQPTGLPPFPGPGWEYDEPPPPAVIARARQLLDELWSRGQGTTRTEQTAARWIVYRAEITRGNKRGVVAYREKRAAPLPAPQPMARQITQERAAPVAVPAQPRVSTPRVAPASAPSMGLPTLRKGIGAPPAPRSADVKLLQQRLGIAADGWFGSGTETAVKEFQRRRGLTVDGVVGPQTWSALFAVRA